MSSSGSHPAQKEPSGSLHYSAAKLADDIISEERSISRKKKEGISQ